MLFIVLSKLEKLGYETNEEFASYVIYSIKQT